jgi:hypothetical protein
MPRLVAPKTRLVAPKTRLVAPKTRLVAPKTRLGAPTPSPRAWPSWKPKSRVFGGA